MSGPAASMAKPPLPEDMYPGSGHDAIVARQGVRAERTRIADDMADTAKRARALLSKRPANADLLDREIAIVAMSSCLETYAANLRRE